MVENGNETIADLNVKLEVTHKWAKDAAYGNGGLQTSLQ